jgi:hypothetical protein
MMFSILFSTGELLKKTSRNFSVMDFVYVKFIDIFIAYKGGRHLTQ